MIFEKDEKPFKEVTKTTTKLSGKPACVISAKGIVVKLHTTAIEKVQEKYSDYFVQNTALDGEGDNVTFYGAGQHLIAALPKSKDDGTEATITKDDAFEVLKIYVNWFSGPDMAKKLTIDMLKPLEEAQEKPKKDKDVEKTLKPKDTEETKESLNIPTFSQFLLEVGTPPDPPDPPDPPESSTDDKAPGYCISYKIEFEGQKSHPIGSALKKLFKDIFSTLGIQLGNWMSGTKGDVHTLGGLAKGFKNIFGGSFDAEKLVSRYNEELKQKMPENDAVVKVIDGSTIISHLGKQLEAADASKIKKATYSLCIKVDKNDKSYKLYNRRLMAELLTSAIDGFFKKIKIKKLGLPRFTKNDVVFVNNYSDSKKTRGEPKYNSNKETGAVSDSIIPATNGKLLLEAVDISSRVDRTRTVLKDTGKSILKERYVSSDVDTIDDVVSRLKSEAAIDSRTIYNLEKYKYAFMLKTEIEKELDESIQSVSGSLLLEDKEDDDLFEDVKKVFIEVIYKIASEFGITTTPSEAAIEALKPMSTLVESKKNEKEQLNTFMNLLFEELIVEAMSEDDVIEGIDKQLRSALTDTIKSQITDKRLKRLQINPKAGFGKVDDVAQILDKIGLLTDEVKTKFEEAKYAFFHAIKITKEETDSDGDKFTVGGSIGNQLFVHNDNIVKSHFSAFENIELAVFISYEKTANKKFAYESTRQPADAKVFIGTVKDSLEPVKPKHKVAQYWVVPDENNIIQPKLKIRVVAFKDPKKPDQWEGIGELTEFDSFTFPSISSMPKNVNDQPAEKFDIDNKHALKDILDAAESGDGETRRQHVLLDPDTDEEFLAIRVIYKSNEKDKQKSKVGVNRTDWDFYIIPIPGLEVKDSTEKDDKVK